MRFTDLIALKSRAWVTWRLVDLARVRALTVWAVMGLRLLWRRPGVLLLGDFAINEPSANAMSRAIDLLLKSGQSGVGMVVLNGDVVGASFFSVDERHSSLLD